jgi:signal transduction histidine kinase
LWWWIRRAPHEHRSADPLPGNLPCAGASGRSSVETGPWQSGPVALSAQEEADALDALIGNVFAHTPEGSAYAVTVARGPGTVDLHVDDAGAGIDDPEAVLPRGATGAGSTGLGLDIARRAAEAAGGALTIGRSPLGGARVTLQLPTNGPA